MMEFEFVDELPDMYRSGKSPLSQMLLEFSAALRENPGRWALYPNPLTRSSTYKTAGDINSGKGSLAFKDGGFQAKTRGGQLYVRYIGTGPGKE